MYVVFLAILFFLLFMALQASYLKREYLKIGGGSLNIRVALITDVHMGLLMVSEKDVATALYEEHPDLVIIAGDMIDKESHIHSFTQWIRRINPDCPVFVTLGNHDHILFKRKPRAKKLFMFNLKSLGIKLIVNESITFHKGNCRINLVGIDDYKRGKPDPKAALAMTDCTADFTLGITHNPETVLTLPKGEIDLLLSGHFHGGQIWMPFGLEFKLFRNEETCKSGYRRGFHIINGTPTYISRGLGNVEIPLRLGSLPEITFIDL